MKKIKNTPFYLSFEDSYFAKGQLLKFKSPGEFELQVVKVYRNTWWRRLFKKFGFKVRINQIKVKSL